MELLSQDLVRACHQAQTDKLLYINIYTKDVTLEFSSNHFEDILKLIGNLPTISHVSDEFSNAFQNFSCKQSSIYGVTILILLQDIAILSKDLEYLSNIIMFIDETKSEPTYVIYPKYKSGDTGLITRCFENLV